MRIFKSPQAANVLLALLVLALCFCPTTLYPRPASAETLSITVTNPPPDVSSPGVNWPLGTWQPITWTSTGAIDTVRITISSWDGETVKTIENTANDGLENYFVELFPVGSSLTDYKITVSWALDPNIYGVSGPIDVTGEPFTDDIKLYTPNGGDKWPLGSSQTITWVSAPGITGNVNIALSRDSGASWSDIATDTPNDGQYEWVVDGGATSKARVRIALSADAAVFKASSYDFDIPNSPAGLFRLTSPNGGEMWQIGLANEVLWAQGSLAGNVNIFYSRDAGVTWSCLVSNTENDGSYPWTVGGLATKSGRIRIESTNDHNTFDVSDGLFSTDKSEMLVISPNGGETWYRGSSKTITWYSRYTSDKVQIELSLDDGVTWTTLVASYVNSGRYDVYVGAPPTTLARIRVKSVTRDNVSDVSDAPFTISEKSLNITFPNGGETLKVGQWVSLKWTQQVGTVDILISRDNGNSWKQLAGNMTPEPFLWQVDDPGTSQALLMVRMHSDHSVFDVSDAVFSVLDKYITLTRPVGGEAWKIDSLQNITWDSRRAEGSVDIDLSRDGGGTWQRLIDNTPNDGKESWPVTGPETTGARVRVRSRTDASIEGISPADFNITASDIILSSPNGGETWATYSRQNITWHTLVAGVSIDLDVSRDGGKHWSEIVARTPNDGVYEWLVTGPPTDQAMIKATIHGKTSSSASGAVFTISPDLSVPEITVVSPNGGENWNVNSSQTISWISRAIDGNVNIDISYNSGTTWKTVASETTNSGSFQWKVAGSTTRNAVVKITSADNATVFDVSDDDFAVLNNPGVDIASPNGGEIWEIGSKQIINWYSNQVSGDVSLQLCRETNGPWEMITAGTEDDGSYQWTVTGPLTLDAKVRVQSLTKTSYSDNSDASFHIVSDTSPYIIVTSPNNEVKWERGTTQSITWTASSVVGNVNIAISHDAGASWRDIITNTPNDGRENWVVTLPGSWKTRIKVYAAADPSVFDVSDKNFYTFPYIYLDWPISTLEWRFGETRDIGWGSMGVTGDVGIDISRDGGASFSVLIESTPNNGRWWWLVTTPDSSNVRFRIRSLEDPTIFGISKPGVSVSGSPIFSLTTPNGGESWAAGSAHAVVWSSGTLTGYLKIELLKGTSVKVIHESTGVRELAFVWNIPSNQTPGTDYRIRVTSAAHSAVTDESDTFFSITPPQATPPPANPLAPTLSLILPNGGESLVKGGTYAVAWQSNLPGLISLDLMKGGALVMKIDSSIQASQGIQKFSVSENLVTGSDYRIKVSSRTDPSLFDLSDNYFSITDISPTSKTAPPTTLPEVTVPYPATDFVKVPPLVSTAGAPAGGIDSATLEGAVVSMGDAASVTVYFEYGTATGPVMTTSPQVMSGLGKFSAQVSGLLPGTTYTFQVKASAGSGFGVIEGQAGSFTTLELPPPPITPANILNPGTTVPAPSTTITETQNSPGSHLPTTSYIWPLIGFGALAVLIVAVAVLRGYKH